MNVYSRIPPWRRTSTDLRRSKKVHPAAELSALFCCIALLAASAMALATPLAAQDGGGIAEAAADGGGPESFTTADGLPSDRVMSLAQTRDGFLWVGTESGLGRFDGRRWRLFDRSSHPTLASERISSLTPDRSGYLWVGTLGGGLYRFDGAFFLPVSRPNQLGGPWNVTALLQQEDSLLWVGTPEDLLYLQPLANSLRYGLPGIPVSCLTIDPYDHVWASAGRGLFRQVQLTFQTLSLPLGVENKNIHSLAMTPAGELMIGREDGLMIARGRFEDSGLPQSIELVDDVAGPVWALLIDRRGRWVAGTADGVWRFDDGRPIRLLSAGVDSDWTVHQLLEDREGSLWVATSAGLHRIAGEATAPVTPVTLAIMLGVDGVARRPAGRHLLPPETELLSVEVAAPTFGKADRVRIRTRLEGHDEAWRDETELEYRGLRPGAYRLAAEASLDGGRTWPIEAATEIEIEPRLHQTLEFWLWLVGGLGAFLVAVGGWFFFLHQRERRFAEMAEQEWREIQEESGMIDPDHDS